MNFLKMLKLSSRTATAFQIAMAAYKLYEQRESVILHYRCAKAFFQFRYEMHIVGNDEITRDAERRLAADLAAAHISMWMFVNGGDIDELDALTGQPIVTDAPRGASATATHWVRPTLYTTLPDLAVKLIGAGDELEAFFGLSALDDEIIYVTQTPDGGLVTQLRIHSPHMAHLIASCAAVTQLRH